MTTLQSGPVDPAQVKVRHRRPICPKPFGCSHLGSLSRTGIVPPITQGSAIRLLEEERRPSRARYQWTPPRAYIGDRSQSVRP
jgi:hypothetical protein